MFLSLVVAGLAAPLAAASRTIESASGVAAGVDAGTGHYEVRSRAPAWVFAGEIGRPLTEVTVQSGRDGIGAYHEITFEWRQPGPLAGSIRVYDQRPVALFSLTCRAAMAKPPADFPDFRAFPAGLMHFSYQGRRFAPYRFDLESAGTPWLLFDAQADAAIVSPASDFLVARMVGDGEKEIGSGWNEGLADLPAGFTHRTLLAFGHGINATWDTWGRALTDLAGKRRPANDADPGLRYLGYWTDNGATYYYHYVPALGYAGTLEKVVAGDRAAGIPVRYLQLDSWWYSKTLTGPDGETGQTKNPQMPGGDWNRYGGLWEYRANPAVLPDGLAGLSRKTGLPLITHDRWMDPASPYHRDYRISGYAVVDPRWWDDTMTYLHDGGVVCYEQDWLDVIYDHSPALRTTVDAGPAFADGMARAAQARGLSLQYCMAPPRFFLQGSRYDNLTTIRVSDDRFSRPRWDTFLYASRLASAVGIWPWSDVFLSTETDNLRLAVLSAGMVGFGDPIGGASRENLRRAARADGVLVKPDAPLVPADAVYLAEARDATAPMVAWTHTDHGPVRTVYVFAYNRAGAATAADFTPAAFGLAGEVWVYDADARTAQRVPAGRSFRLPLAKGASAALVIAPATPAGLAFFGDEGKFVGTGRQRIAAIEDQAGKLAITVTFAAEEKSVRLFGYATAAPRIEARSGGVSDVVFDAATGRCEWSVSPAPAVSKEMPGGDPVRHAEIVVSAR